MKQSETRNLTMMMDLYEMTMANGYFNDQDKDTRVAFDVFYRSNPDGGGFAIFAGLEQILEYIENLHFDEEDIAYFRSLNIFTEDFLAYLKDFKFSGDIYAFKEGTIMYPNEPIITVVAPLIDAQLIETALLAQVNHQSLIATKTRRIVSAAEGRAVSDFGARRAHNMDAAVYGARAAYIGGAVGTATVLAGQMFDIPVSGTMAHSWVMYYEDEFEAFKHYAENYPDGTVLLVDTYDVIGSGIPNAIRVAKEVLEPNTSVSSHSEPSSPMRSQGQAFTCLWNDIGGTSRFEPSLSVVLIWYRRKKQSSSPCSWIIRNEIAASVWRTLLRTFEKGSANEPFPTPCLWVT